MKHINKISIYDETVEAKKGQEVCVIRNSKTGELTENFHKGNALDNEGLDCDFISCTIESTRGDKITLKEKFFDKRVFEADPKFIFITK